MIASFIDGRVRLRSPALCSQDTLEEITGMLSAYAGVKKIETNARTGSLLVLYDPAAISREHLNMAVAMLESTLQVPASRPKGSGSRRKGLTLRKIENRLLLGGALITLVSAAGNMKSLHVAGGALFLLLAARHTYARRAVF